VTELLERYGVEIAVFGHLHAACAEAFRNPYGVRSGVTYYLRAPTSSTFPPCSLRSSLTRGFGGDMAQIESFSAQATMEPVAGYRAASQIRSFGPVYLDEPATWAEATRRPRPSTTC